LSKLFKYFPILIIISLISGCSQFRLGTAKRVGKGKQMLKKVIIKCDNPDIDMYEIYGYVKQKPNRKLIGINTPHIFKRGSIGRKNLLVNGSGFPLYLQIHNLVNSKREARRKIKRDARYERKKVKWQNFPITKYGRKRKEPKKRRTIGEFLYDIGEPPIILDSTKTDRTAHQLELYLSNKGYFNSTVKDTVVYPFIHRYQPRKAIQCYIIHPTQPYRIRHIAWTVQDPGLEYDVMSDTANTLIKTGNNYDVDVFEQEQSRITRSLRNNGYFLFNKDYIRFSIDTALGSHQADVTIIIRKQQTFVNDSTIIESPHQRFQVGTIVVKSVYKIDQLREDDMHYDTTVFHDMAFLRNTDSLTLPKSNIRTAYEPVLKYKPELLSSRINFQTGTIYSQANYEGTYRQLNSLRVFKQVVIQANPRAGTDHLDIVVYLFPIIKQNYTTQLELTNTGGNLGVGGGIVYQNNNVYHGAEIFEFKIKGGTEAQQPIAAGNNTGGNNSQLAFNTIQAGLEANMYIPREFFPFGIMVSNKRTENERKAQERRTVFTASVNYQRRIDFDRGIGNLSYGYTFRYGRFSRFGIYPIEINVVKVNPKEGLEQLLQNGDPLLRYRFTDHLIHNCRFSYTYNNLGRIKNQKNVDFFKIDIEAAGNALYLGYKTFGAIPDAQGSYLLGGIPFAQYFRFSFDYRHYQNIGNHEQIVIRLAHGIGLPLKNFPTLPLEKSFYGGGANGIRAWEARTLGPGSYIIPADQKYAQFGDIQAEYNIELRFRVTKTLYGAIFADGGNIWLLNADPLRPDAEFNFSKFFNDLAFGPGFGIRYDLSFFVVRLDWAFKVRDPSRPYGERWYIPGQRRLQSNLNFGIGYPF
jgi:outer membrane protein assembly factor BamA